MKQQTINKFLIIIILIITKKKYKNKYLFLKISLGIKIFKKKGYKEIISRYII
jgi:hypothetical protein